MQSLLKLLQITSPGLPVGAYSYSQGLEWAVEAGWLVDRLTTQQWLQEQLSGTMTQQELPVLIRLYAAHQGSDQSVVHYWEQRLLAMRETSELRHEERQRGRALCALINSLGVGQVEVAYQSQLSGFAYFCVAEGISLDDSLHGYAYSWLDNQVTASVKLVPLGQSEGQAILYELGDCIQQAVSTAGTVADDEIGYSSPALAMASSLHETQYCRLFRS